MREFTLRGHGAVRLAAVAGLVVAFAGCGDKKDSGSTFQPAKTWSISGTVIGTVTAGVKVRIQGQHDSATTDAGGLYTIAGLVDGTYTVEASLDGYAFAPATRSVAVDGANVTGQDFVSHVSIAISGTVTGDAGAGVTMTLTGPEPATTTATVTTDADGDYAFLDVATGVYSLTPSLAGGFAFVPENCRVTVTGQSVTNVAFSSAGVHAISGTVSGTVVAGVTVALEGDATRLAVTALDGTYTFTDLPNGAYTVTPSLAGYAFSPGEASVTLANADATGVNFVSSATHRIAGTISGDVLEGVTVTLSGAAADDVLTDAMGRFEFTDLVDGDYVVTPSLDKYTFAPASRSITLAGAAVTNADFVSTLIPTYTVTGTVSGAIVEGVIVALSGQAEAIATTDVNGDYTFTGLLNGSYMVIPLDPGYAFDPASRAFRINGANVTGQDFAASAVP